MNENKQYIDPFRPMHSLCLATVNCKCGCCYLCCTNRYSALHGGLNLNLGAPLVFACFGWSPFNFKWRSTGLGQALIYITKKDPIIKYSEWTAEEEEEENHKRAELRNFT